MSYDSGMTDTEANTSSVTNAPQGSWLGEAPMRGFEEDIGWFEPEARSGEPVRFSEDRSLP